MGMPAKFCGHGVMEGKDVHANQKTPTGKITAPNILGHSLSSGLEHVMRVENVWFWVGIYVSIWKGDMYVT